MSISPEAAAPSPNISPQTEKSEVKEPIFKIGDKVAITGVRELRHEVWDSKPTTLKGTIDAHPVTNQSNIAVIRTHHNVRYYRGTRFVPSRQEEAGSAIYYRVDSIEVSDGTIAHFSNYFSENQLDVPSDE